MPERCWQIFFFFTHFEDTYHPDVDCTSVSLHLRECKRWFVFKKSDYLRISRKAAISVLTMFLREGHKQFVQGVREADQWCLGDQSSVLSGPRSLSCMTKSCCLSCLPWNTNLALILRILSFVQPVLSVPPPLPLTVGVYSAWAECFIFYKLSLQVLFCISGPSK